MCVFTRWLNGCDMFVRICWRIVLFPSRSIYFRSILPHNECSMAVRLVVAIAHSAVHRMALIKSQTSCENPFCQHNTCLCAPCRPSAILPANSYIFHLICRSSNKRVHNVSGFKLHCLRFLMLLLWFPSPRRSRIHFSQLAARQRLRWLNSPHT